MATRVASGTLANVLETLVEQTDNVLVVERVEDHLSRATLADQPEATQQTELMGDG